MRITTARLSNKGFALIGVSIFGAVVLVALSIIFLSKNKTTRDTTISLIPANPTSSVPTLAQSVSSSPSPKPTNISQLTGNYQYIPKICQEDLKSEECKSQFKALLDEKCGGRLRNQQCTPVRQEIFTYASERVCSAKPESGACKCLQSQDFRSPTCKDAFREMFSKVVEGVCQPDPNDDACKCLQAKDFISQTCRDAYFDFFMAALAKKCSTDPSLPACKCVAAPDQKACLQSLRKK